MPSLDSHILTNKVHLLRRRGTMLYKNRFIALLCAQRLVWVKVYRTSESTMKSVLISKPCIARMKFPVLGTTPVAAVCLEATGLDVINQNKKWHSRKETMFTYSLLKRWNISSKFPGSSLKPTLSSSRCRWRYRCPRPTRKSCYPRPSRAFRSPQEGEFLWN